MQNQSTTPAQHNTRAALIVGHGTRNVRGAEQFLALVQTIQRQMPQSVIAGCFLELSEPSIHRAIEDLAASGICELVIVPVLLFSAGHAKKDIPEEVDEVCEKFGISVLAQTDSLGTHPAVISLSQTRFQEASLWASDHGCRPGHCGNINCPLGTCFIRGKNLGRIGLAMVGRGSSDLDALEHMRSFTQLRTTTLPVEWSETGYFVGGQPNVDKLLELAANAACDTIVVQPHLLFEGELIHQLRNKVLEKQQTNSDKNWIICQLLGADGKLASVFTTLIGNQLAKLQD